MSVRIKDGSTAEDDSTTAAINVHLKCKIQIKINNSKQFINRDTYAFVVNNEMTHDFFMFAKECNWGRKTRRYVVAG